MIGTLLALLLIAAPASAGIRPDMNERDWRLRGRLDVFLKHDSVYGGMQKAYSRRYDGGLLIDEFESDDEGWLVNEWDDEDREAVLVEHLQDKQQEAIDRKRRRQEASEDARVDAILARLTDTSLDRLSEEDRAILKRASRRYRQRRSSEDDDS